MHMHTFMRAYTRTVQVHQYIPSLLLHSEGNTSIATYEYFKVGVYKVKVEVSNHLQPDPVIAHLPRSVIVQEPLTDVQLVQLQPVTQGEDDQSRTYGAFFSSLENSSDLVVFEAK